MKFNKYPPMDKVLHPSS